MFKYIIKLYKAHKDKYKDYNVTHFMDVGHYTPKKW